MIKYNNEITYNGLSLFIYYIIPFSLFLDILYVFFPVSDFIVKSPLAVLKALIMYSFIAYIIVKKKVVYGSISKQIIVFFLFVLCIMPFSSDPIFSLRISSQVMISLFGFIAAFSLIRNYSDLIKLNNSIIIFMVLIILNFVVADLFHLGGTDYTGGDDFQAAGLQDSYNNLTYSLLLVPMIIHFTSAKKKKFLIYVISIIIFILLLLTLKRIAITGALFGFLLYFLNSKNKIRLIGYLVLIAIILIAFLPVYEDTLFQRFVVRADQGRFSSDFYETEGRYIESFYVWSTILSFSDPLKSLFGLEAFNSVGNYLGGMFGARGLHIDYNLVVFTNGLVGFLLYMLIYYKLFKSYNQIKSIKDNKTTRILKSLFIVLSVTSLFTSFGGQMYHISFRLIVFIYLGAILSILLRVKYDNLISKQKQTCEVLEDENTIQSRAII